MARNLKALRNAIDEYIGSGGDPGALIRTIADSMEETAEHIATNWQDPSTAKVWRREAAKVNAFGSRLSSWYETEAL